MITQILNRDFIMSRLSDVLGCLKEPPKERPEFAEDISDETFSKAADELASTKEAEDRESSGQPGYEPPATRRGEPPLPLDDVAFVSRDERISVLQSALEEYFLTQEPGLVQPVTAPKPGRRSGPGLIPVAGPRACGRAGSNPRDLCRTSPWPSIRDTVRPALGVLQSGRMDGQEERPARLR